MKIKNEAEKNDFYEQITKTKEETYILVRQKGKIFPRYIMTMHIKGKFFELPCVLFSYTFTKGNTNQEKFMKEQGYIVIKDKAYDIQTPFNQDPVESLGEFCEISKTECVNWMIKNGGMTSQGDNS